MESEDPGGRDPIRNLWIRRLFPLLSLVLQHDDGIGDNSSNSDDDANDRLITYSTSRSQPSQSHDGTSLDVADDRARYWAGLRDDEELRHVDYACEKSRHHDHDPSIHWHLGPYWESVDKWDNIEQHKSCQRGLVEQQLHAVHLELLVVAGDPDRVERAGENSSESENNAQAARGLDFGICCRQRIIV